MYNITVWDRYSPAIVTVPVNMLSVEFPYNGTSIVVNRKYTITVSAISDQGTGCPSDPVVVGKFHTGVPTSVQYNYVYHLHCDWNVRTYT